MIGYTRKVYDLDEQLEEIRDGRQEGRIPTGCVVRTFVLTAWLRLGSLNAMDECRPGGMWRKWLGGDLPSGDTVGDVAETMELENLREVAYENYKKQRRNKSLRPWRGGLRPLLFDGHELGASYLRSCSECLTRTITTKKGERIQYYHRYVAAMLLHQKGQLLLDLELQQPGEGEMPAARRLLKRLLARYPRAFNVVAGDALYLDPEFCKLALAHRKDFIAVLKNENRDLIADARSLLPEVETLTWQKQKTRGECWDLEGFTTWTQLGHAVRVVRSVETTTVHRQRTDEDEEQTTEWLWATSLSPSKAGTQTVVCLGHGRWTIENQGFNELVNEWHADHLYRHEVNAIQAFLLMTFIALNLKLAIRVGHTVRYWVAQLQAEFRWLLLHAASLAPP